MKEIKTILIFGASGSGSTTLAKAIEKNYGYHFIDTDDALWEKTDPPFTVQKKPEDTLAYVKSEMSIHEKNVLSGSIIGFGNELKTSIDFVIYLHLPLEVRIERIKTREQHRFKERVLPGGDLYKQHLEFIEWVKLYDILDESVRSKKQHEKWLEDITVPILRINEVLSIDTLLSKVDPYLH